MPDKKQKRAEELRRDPKTTENMKNVVDKHLAEMKEIGKRYEREAEAIGNLVQKTTSTVYLMFLKQAHIALHEKAQADIRAVENKCHAELEHKYGQYLTPD